MWNPDAWMCNRTSDLLFLLTVGLCDLVIDDFGLTTFEYALLVSLLAMLVTLGVLLSWQV